MNDVHIFLEIETPRIVYFFHKNVALSVVIRMNLIPVDERVLRFWQEQTIARIDLGGRGK